MSELCGRHCRLQVPDDWRRDPPLGARQSLPEGDAAAVQIIERTLAVPMSATDVVAEVRDHFADLFEGGEMLAERAQPVAGGFTGHRLSFTFRNDDFEVRRRDWLVVTAGPYACEATIERPAASGSCPDCLTDDILASLAMQGLSFCAAAGPLQLSARLEAVEPASGLRRSFPFLGRSLAEPEGWEPEPAGDGLRLRHQEAELSVERVPASDGDALDWLHGRIEALARDEHRVLGSGQWDDEGGAWAALVLEEREQTRTWKTSAHRYLLELYSGTPVPVVFRLRALPERTVVLESALLSLTKSAQALPEAEWRTRVAEGWLDQILAGPWQHLGEGLYLCLTSAATSLCVLAQATPSSLAVLERPLIENARQGFGSIASEETAQGRLRGVRTLSTRIGGRNRSGEPHHLRAIWLNPEGALYTCLVQGGEEVAVAQVGGDLGRGLRVPGMEAE